MTLDELEIKCRECTQCGLCEGRTNLVFGEGKKDADIMLIGEGPGENEDLQGRPFVGRSGQLLDKFLASVDLSREKNGFTKDKNISLFNSLIKKGIIRKEGSGNKIIYKLN